MNNNELQVKLNGEDLSSKEVLEIFKQQGIMYYDVDKSHKENINDLVDDIFSNNKSAGWHDKPRETGTMLALIHSEISEAMEGDRKGLMDDHLPHRKMFEVELADAMIRIMDLAGREGLDLGGAIVEKLEYNKIRLDHKKENREKEGGKKY